MAPPTKKKKKAKSELTLLAEKERTQKAAMGRHLNCLVADVEAIKANSNGMIPNGAISSLIQKERSSSLG
jgi:hypothetical protein